MNLQHAINSLTQTTNRFTIDRLLQKSRRQKWCDSICNYVSYCILNELQSDIHELLGKSRVSEGIKHVLNSFEGGIVFGFDFKFIFRQKNFYANLETFVIVSHGASSKFYLIVRAKKINQCDIFRIEKDNILSLA